MTRWIKIAKRVADALLLIATLASFIWAIMTGQVLLAICLGAMLVLAAAANNLYRMVIGRSAISAETARNFQAVVQQMEVERPYVNDETGEAFLRLPPRINGALFLQRDEVWSVPPDGLPQASEWVDHLPVVTWTSYWAVSLKGKVFNNQVFTAPDGAAVNENFTEVPSTAKPASKWQTIWRRMRHVEHIKADESTVRDLIARIQAAQIMPTGA